MKRKLGKPRNHISTSSATLMQTIVRATARHGDTQMGGWMSLGWWFTSGDAPVLAVA